ncbi:MAG: hypothetical protein ACP5DC_09265, partial [Halothiobacillaceae bacterium]
MKRILLAACAALVLCAQGALAQTPRDAFRTALDAVSAGQLEQAREQLAALVDYPLRPYLEYRILRASLDEVPVGRTLAFERDWPHFYLAGALREAKLHQLAEQERWSDFLGAHRPETDNEVTLGCHRLHAEYRLEQPSGQWLTLAREKWLSGSSRPEACDPVFDVLYERQWIDEDHRRTRIRLAVEQGNLGLARYLARGQSQSVREYLALLEQARSEPLAYLTGEVADGGSGVDGRNAVRVAAFRWAAREDLDRAMALADLLPESWRLSVAEQAGIWREIGLRAAWRHRPEALGWLARVPDDHADETVRAWRVRAALR